jgi:tetratricopeptide (TPR) repeat protein
MALTGPAKELQDKAHALYSENRYSQAKKVLLENIARYPDYAPSHLLLGQIHLFSRKPDYDAALREFREVVRINASWTEGHQWLGYAFERVGDIDEAIASYREVVRLAPVDARPHVALGNCFVRKGWYSEAIKMFRRGLELKPYGTEADVRVLLAGVLVNNGRIKEACLEWRRVLEIEAGYPSDDAPHQEAKRMLAKYCGKS